MGLFDKFKGKATDAVDQHGDTIGDGLGKAGDVVDQKTGGKHTERIDSAVDQTGDRLDALDGKNDDIPDAGRGNRPAGE